MPAIRKGYFGRMKTRNNSIISIAVAGGALLATALHVGAQAPTRGGGNKQPAAPAARGGGGGGGAYPQRTPEQASVNRGKAIYDVNCAFCHGEDARGGDNGPNLIRGDVVLNDKDGETIGKVLQTGRLAEGMPKFEFTAAQISDVSSFLHSFRVGGYDVTRNRPATIVVGDAKAGETYFRAKCTSCHSTTGDLKGIATRVTDGRTLQQRWIMPTGGGRGGGQGTPTTVTVTAGAQKVEGRLGRIDDFIVTLTEADGTPRTFRRDGDSPKVEVHDPLQPHKDLLRTYTDKDIHDVTAYMVTLK
jgi:cytochrome c oxidase cbb3-type subunit 3